MLPYLTWSGIFLFSSFHPFLLASSLLITGPVIKPSLYSRHTHNATQYKSGSITPRHAPYSGYWPGDARDCNPLCFCESSDQATCVGAKIKFIPLKLNPYIRVLEIMDASLVSIRTDSFKSYPHLEQLSLINCSILRIEAFAFRGLMGLKTLNFNSNPVTHLSRYSFAGIFNVQVLNLTQNRIKRIHSFAFESSSFIKHLLLHHNPLSHISARSFAGLSHVESLLISSPSNPTPVSTIEPDGFWGLVGVKDLHLACIPLTRLTPFAFRGLKDVGHLFLYHSNITVIESHAFSGLVNAAYVHLDQCQIRHIHSSAFASMSNVSYVDLSKNELYELSQGSVDGIKETVSHLDLMENPWHCNCSIHWMHQVATNFDDVSVLTRSMMSLRCHTPPEMRGRYFAQLDRRRMRCPTVAVERRIREGEDPNSTLWGVASSGAWRPSVARRQNSGEETIFYSESNLTIYLPPLLKGDFLLGRFFSLLLNVVFISCVIKYLHMP